MFLKNFYLSVVLLSVFTITGCKDKTQKEGTFKSKYLKAEKERVLTRADEYKNKVPVTVTDSVSERSQGGKHDFYSEGDYWWPDPENPGGAYIRKDGLTNPDNFNADRKALIRLNQISGALASAYLVTGNKEYIKKLLPHLQAWFVNEATKMNPNLRFGQAISGVVSGRGIGIIDTVHLIEVAKAIEITERSGVASKKDIAIMKSWFRDYLTWISTSDFGKAERDNGNNHSVTWALQVAAFADLLKDKEQLNFCRTFYEKKILPEQMDEKGAFPKELARTKPYGYSIFNLDAMSSLCQILSTPQDDLFNYHTKNGKSISLGLKFLYPYLKDKSKWPYKKDVLHWEDWPVQQSALLFGGLAFKNEEYLQLWNSLDSDYSNPEVIRNMPIKYPLLWLN
ncbi:Alginate lyase [Salegentibacter echinorum]|uniref:Alginate lyase n=1 Tax=Salegentibacter echinorum TaxID=1073325 RepID=A0A1M5HG48_SALEC|nr:alginate lyase family protein [Salegentibacter echinorum]SHG14802.1 Alginate lyase [Salegentibacter echinorum]